ncbi:MULTISPECIES: hypothetical protein [Micrococcaceae]|uniref:hypothetical protein n=1 Tax=Micrococcaceae TaxID=1268 RepID=UPI002B055DC2|nr:hypothetical protein [Pseudarthrobacter sp. C1]MEA3550008.1 hypothetical protein [Pseudarthrobacter sp. C1]
MRRLGRAEGGLGGEDVVKRFVEISTNRTVLIDKESQEEGEAKRVELYKSVAALVRTYGAIANDMTEAGYDENETSSIAKEVAHYVAVRDEVKLGAGENVDFKQYEAGMRFLLDTYIRADASEAVADFQDVGLVQLIVEQGSAALDKLPSGIKKDPEAVAETIANNIRKVIIDENAMNPEVLREHV